VGFTKIEPAITGIAFTHALSLAAVARNRILAGGSGVALGDVDGDGRTDLYFCRLLGANALYLNRGNWRFEEAPMAGGAPCAEQASTGVVLADVEGDGDLDLYVANYRENSSRDAPPGVEARVIRGSKGEYLAIPKDRFVALAGPTSVSLVELGEADVLYRNVGGARFERVSWTNGFFKDASGTVLVEPPMDWGLSVMFRDIDGDSWPGLGARPLLVDRAGRLWLSRKTHGTPALGLATLDADAGVLRPHNLREIPAHEEVLCGIEDSAGTLWFGTAASGVLRLTPARVEVFGPSQGLPDEDVWSISARDQDGSLWFATTRGAVRIHPDAVQAAPTPTPVIVEARDISRGPDSPGVSTRSRHVFDGGSGRALRLRFTAPSPYW